MKDSTTKAQAPTKLFIGGIERSGTTVLASALARYLNGVAIPEAQFKKFLLASDTGPEVMRDVRQSMRFRLWDLPYQEYQAASGAETFDCIVDHMLAKHGIATPALTIDHTPENCGCGAELLAAFPEACLIHITRDPRAVISSLMRTDWGVPTLGDALSYWRKRNALAERAFALAEGSLGARVATLSYEELCDAPDKTLARLCDALVLTRLRLNPLGRHWCHAIRKLNTNASQTCLATIFNGAPSCRRLTLSVLRRNCQRHRLGVSTGFNPGQPKAACRVHRCRQGRGSGSGPDFVADGRAWTELICRLGQARRLRSPKEIALVVLEIIRRIVPQFCTKRVKGRRRAVNRKRFGDLTHPLWRESQRMCHRRLQSVGRAGPIGEMIALRNGGGSRMVRHHTGASGQ